MINLDDVKLQYTRCLTLGIDCIIDDCKYGLYDGNSLELLEYLGDEENIVIEEGVNIIGKSCFARKNIKSIVLPSTLTRISNGAFLESSIESVLLNSNCDVVIASGAFKNSKLKNINLENVVEVSYNAFKGTYIQFADLSKCTLINRFAFSDCLNLETVIFNQNEIVDIKNDAFRNCAIKELILNKAILGESAFSKTKLENIIIYDKCDFEYGVFYGCINLKNVYAPKIEYLSSKMFAFCGDFREFITPNIKYIGADAFEEVGIVNLIAHNLNDLFFLSFSHSSGDKKIYTRTKKINSCTYLNLVKYDYLLYYYSVLNNKLYIYEVDENCNIIKELDENVLSLQSRNNIIDSVFKGDY